MLWIYDEGEFHLRPVRCMPILLSPRLSDPYANLYHERVDDNEVKIPDHMLDLHDPFLLSVPLTLMSREDKHDIE